jgi:hypothetical protein
MHKPRFGGDYGFGFWMIRDSTTGDTLIHHGGAIQGQRAFLIGDVNAKVGVYYMTNSDFLPDAVPPSELTDAALKLLRGEDYVPRPAIKGIAVDDKVLDSYVGTYDLGPASLVVSRIGRALAIQQTGQTARNELLAETPARFVQRGTRNTFTFDGEGGRIDRVVVQAGAQRLTATRRK